MFKLKLLGNKKGNAYIYILIVMMSSLLMLRLVINITSQSVLISEATHKSSNLYHMSKSGIDKGVYSLNNVIYTNKHSINNKVLKDMQNMTYKDMLIFIPEEDNLYSGIFLFENEYFIYKTLFENYASEYIEDFLLETEGKINFIIDNYNIDIFVDNNPIVSNDYNITSVATDTNTNISLTLVAKVSFIGEVYDEILVEKYKWYDMPIYFSNVVNEYEDFYEIFNSQANLYEDNWSYEYPILFNNEDTLTIDLSNFYYNGYPTNTIIINNGQGDLYIYTSEESKNIFNGIIISLGNIVFHEADYIVEGSLISGGYIENYNVDMIANSEILFNLDFNNIIDERKLYDALFLTNFSLGDGYPLTRLDICNNSPMEINIYKPIILQTLYLSQVN